MPRNPVPFSAPDLSSLARSLREQLALRPSPPGHLDLLNMLARAVGRRNYQQLHAEALTPPRRSDPTEPEPADIRRAERVARQFDAFGQLVRLPARPVDQSLALWVLWSDLPADQDLTEAEVNALLRNRHMFDDPATLRRMMVSAGLLARTDDGRVYRRIERRPPSDALLLIRLAAREPAPAMVMQVESFLRRKRREETAGAKRA